MSTYCISCNKSPLSASADGLNMCASGLKAEKQRSIATEPAFPIDLGIEKAYGLTKREWFAGMAMSECIKRHFDSPMRVRQVAYEFADAMLKEGAK